MIDLLIQDVRYAIRTFVRNPGFVLLAILTIAIGVGANAAIFSVVNAVLLRPLPFPRPHELVLIGETDKQAQRNHGTASLRTSSTGGRAITASQGLPHSPAELPRCPRMGVQRSCPRRR